MRIVVIGGSGHIGTYLSPMLVEAGHSVVCVCRGIKQPYQPHPAWADIAQVILDRTAEEVSGEFGRKVAELGADAVVDLTCYTLASAGHMVNALRGKVGHFLHCGTIWVHGHSVEVPTLEDAPRTPFGDYGCRKAAIEKYLLQAFRDTAFPVTILHPGHLVGRGWFPINPAGNFNPAVFSDLANGREILLPNLGMETLHHVHASDVAAAFVRAVATGEASLGESFHVVSPAALTLRGFAERMITWFGSASEIRYLPWQEWQAGVSEKDARITRDHIEHSPNCSIEKARRILGYAPQYTSLGAVQESVSWLLNAGLLPGVQPKGLAP